MAKKNGLGRAHGKPKRAREGWVVLTNNHHDVDGAKGRVQVPATYIEGGLTGVWIYDAGVEGQGQDGFEICGDPDFLDELADAFKLLAEDIRAKSGWTRT
jgi:hypothetical protein